MNINRTTGFVVFHVFINGTLACDLRREWPDGPFVRCVICEQFAPRGVKERGRPRIYDPFKNRNGRN